MYIWNVESLKQKFKSRTFSDKDLIPYVALYAGLYALGTESMGYLPYEDVNIWTYTLSVLSVLIPIVGTIYSYKCNGGSDGKDFASKYFSIGFVVFIRFLASLLLVIAVLIIYWENVFNDQKELPTTFFEVLLISGWLAMLYIRMGKHIGDTANV